VFLFLLKLYFFEYKNPDSQEPGYFIFKAEIEIKNEAFKSEP